MTYRELKKIIKKEQTEKGISYFEDGDKFKDGRLRSNFMYSHETKRDMAIDITSKQFIKLQEDNLIEFDGFDLFIIKKDESLYDLGYED